MLARFLTILLISFQVFNILDIGASEADDPMMKCGDTKLKNMDTFTKSYKSCFEKLKPKDVTDEKALEKYFTNNTCYNVCIYKEIGILKKDGSFDEEVSTKLTKSIYPTEDLQNKFIESSKACVKSSGAEKALSMDDNCKAYSPLIQCHMEQHDKICNTKK